MVECRIEEGDICYAACDMMILKYADGFHGVDKIVAERMNFSSDVPEGRHAFLRGHGTEAHKVAFFGVGPLSQFRYERIHEFAYSSLSIVGQGTGRCERICSPIHGPGYGLDERESFLSLAAGFEKAIVEGSAPQDLTEIVIVEKSSSRAQRLKMLLNEFNLSSLPRYEDRPSLGRMKDNRFGAASETKKKFFVAMPFAESLSDVWEIAITEAAAKCKISCERIDEQAFTGDIVSEIKRRIENCVGLIAVLDEANPNVFLEIGYAWAMQKPTILVSASSKDLPFDIKGQRCLIYRSLNDLRTRLTAELQSLYP